MSIINKRHNRLIIIKEYKSLKHKGGSKQRVKFLCDCGKIGNSAKWAVLSNRTKSCGCYNTDTKGDKLRKLKPKQVYGIVQFLKYIKGTKRKQYKCFCGTIFQSFKTPFEKKRGKQIELHCGCLTKQNQSDSLKKDYKHIRIRYNAIKSRKKHELQLTFEEYVNLCKQDCTYCGYNPINDNKMIILKNRNSPQSQQIYNGVDRVDSDLGYIKNNVVSCCADCNKMKSNMSIFDFFIKIIKIVRFTKIKQIN